MRQPRARRRGATEPGFTIIELMIVVTIFAIVALIAVPNLIRSRMSAREAATVSVMRSVSTAQAQFWRAGYADEDGDGQGEFGTFAELAGRSPVRSTGSLRAPTDLSGSMGRVGASGDVARAGYVFRLYLPLPAGLARRENGGGGMDAGVLDPNLAEMHWACYAWPERYGASGERTFFVNERCDLCAAEDPAYTGEGCPALRAGAAFRTSNLDGMTAQVAVGTRGADGNSWKTVQ